MKIITTGREIIPRYLTLLNDASIVKGSLNKPWLLGIENAIFRENLGDYQAFSS